MAKFMVLYNSDAKASETMANASAEEMKASMAEWMEWKGEAEKTAKVEFGLPLEVVSRVTSDGVTNSDTKVSGYSIVEAESKAAILKVLKNHPQLKRPEASLDVLEMLSMPGLDA